MNSHQARHFPWQKLWREDRWRGLLLISVVFLLLLGSLLVSLGRYWSNTLQPRLYASADTQAQILANSQATLLTKVLEQNNPELMAQNLLTVIREILIATDPAIDDRMVRSVALHVDYDMVSAEPGSLDLAEGERACSTCFTVSVPLMNQAGDLLGVADFAITDRYFTLLSGEMKSKLYAESSLVLGLLLIVWLTMLVMFDRLHRAKQMIEASDQAKTRFMANVTHELRTPLNAILGYTQLYKADPALMTSHGQGIQTIHRTAEHLLLLINDILDFSRTDQRKLQLHLRETHLPTLLNTLVEMASISAKLKGIQFLAEFPNALPISILADDKRLRQVLINLLSNAVKFTEHGEVHFRVELLRREPDHVLLKFTVTDTGIGIAKVEVANIFIPFHQIDNAITRAEGSGLGLTISQRIVRLMGGELRVKSELNKGSEFSFEIKVQTLSEENNRPVSVTETMPMVEPLVLPPADVIQALLEQSRQHNVLAVRKLMEGIESSGEYPSFTREVQPFVRNYRFKQLSEWLESVSKEP